MARPGQDRAPRDPAAHDLDAVEEWFVHRGVPHFVERHPDGSALDARTRALPLFVAAYLLLGLNALDLNDWSLAENLAVAGMVVAILIAAWAVSNRVRGMPTFARPTDIDAPELVLFVLGPALPVVIVGQFEDAVENVVAALVFLGGIYVWSAYGLGPLLRWGVRHGSRQLETLGSLVARALPLLLLFNTFLFINAEVWEVAGTLQGPAYAVVIATFFLLGAAFAVIRIPRVVRSLNHFDSWDELGAHLTGTPAEGWALPGDDGDRDVGVDRAPPVDRLRFRQRLNIGLVILFGQAIQITLVTAAIIGFFVGFGVVAIGADTTSNWTGIDELRLLADVGFGGRTLVLSEPLIRVAVFLGAFSGMYFTVVLTTDDTYRTEFSNDVGPEIREALAVRTAYRVARGTHGDTSAHGDTDPHGDNGTA